MVIKSRHPPDAAAAEMTGRILSRLDALEPAQDRGPAARGRPLLCAGHFGPLSLLLLLVSISISTSTSISTSKPVGTGAESRAPVRFRSGKLALCEANQRLPNWQTLIGRRAAPPSWCHLAARPRPESGERCHPAVLSKMSSALAPNSRLRRREAKAHSSPPAASSRSLCFGREKSCARSRARSRRRPNGGGLRSKQRRHLKNSNSSREPARIQSLQIKADRN